MHFSVYFQHFGSKFNQTKPKQVQTHSNSNFQIPLCLLCLLCTHVSKFDRLLKTHSNHDNSNNKIGRQFKFTSKVTLIGPTLCQIFSPIQQLLAKLSTILYMAASFKTIPIGYLCVSNCIKIHSYEYFFQDHFGSFKTIFT